MVKKERKKKTKIDNETMRATNIMFLIIIIILLVLLSFGIASIINPELINNIKASVLELFN